MRFDDKFDYKHTSHFRYLYLIYNIVSQYQMYVLKSMSNKLFIKIYLFMRFGI